MKSNKIITLLLICFVQFLLPVDTFSSSENAIVSDNEIYTLGEIVVLGKREGVESIGTVYKVTEENIRISGARNLNEAIDMLPGVNVMVGGDAVPKIDIRGFRPRHNILLLNGIPINSTYDQQFNPSIIPVENIAEIKMTSGASSVLYGQGGLGGVINIITKKGTEGIKGMVGGEVGQGGSHLEKTNISGQKGKVDFFSSASFHHRDAIPLSDDFEDTALEGGDYRDNSDKETASFFSNLGYDPSENISIGLTFNYLSGEYGIPVVIYDSASDIFASNKKFERIESYNGYSLQLASEYYPDDASFSLRGWIFFNQMDEKHNRFSDDDYHSFTIDPNLITYKLESNTTVKGITLQPKYDFGDIGTLTIGLSAELDAWESNGVAWNRWNPEFPPGYLPQDVDDGKEVSVYAVKMEYEYTPLSTLGFTLGYAYHYQDRHDHSEYEDVDNPNHIISIDEETDNDYGVLIGGYYDVVQSTRLKAAYQRNIRFPSIRQLYDVDAGNPGLTTECVYHYSAGIEQHLPKKIRLTIDGFYTIARDFIEKDTRRSEQFENFDKYLFTGAEVTTEIKTVKNLFLRACYSYLHTEDKTGSGKDELQYRPKHRVTLESKYHFQWGFTPYISFVYVADQYYYEKGGNPWDIPEKAKLDDYFVVNVKLNYTFKDNYSLYVGADNLLDESYEQSYGYALSGRCIFGGGEVRF